MNAVETLLDILGIEEYWYQLELNLPPEFVLPIEYFTSVQIPFGRISPSGNYSSNLRTEDHPAFSNLREYLGREGFIKIERSWWNGDRVLKPFYLNGLLFNKGDQFASASAQSYNAKRKMKVYEPCKESTSTLTESWLTSTDNIENYSDPNQPMMV